MRYHVSDEQKRFFRKGGFIDFEDLLAPEDIEKLKIQKVVFCPRDDAGVEKIVHSSSLFHIARQLSEKNTLRFAFDRVFTSAPLKASFTLQQMSSIQPLLMACMIGLEGGREAGEQFYPFPKPSTLRFFLPSCRWPLGPFDGEKGYLITWADPICLYYFSEHDPCTHELKKRGYVFGDRVGEPWHPLMR
jgi:hypothetical protein